ncbi:MAG: tungsten ABC transporter substrate-binding protein [Deltaproteobacteria bacterium]|nr:tungsten ABC transporter substrate-binding protein [Deltaproteobacteria bacterium]
MKFGYAIMAALVLLAGLVSPAWAAEEKPVLMMATTTSTDNTGLLDILSPLFTKATGIELRWTAVGTGKALKLGENCDVDVLLVHAPDAEKKYVADGFGVDRREVMYNDFVIIGPTADPAGIRKKSVAEALKLIADSQAVMVSRGDKSGTHQMEIDLWKSSGMPVPEKETWYVQTGQGMLPTMTVAAERNGYTLTDRGTFIKYEDTMKGNPPLVILVEGDPGLFNQYSVMAVNPERCPKAKYDLATKFSDWIAGPEGQQAIGAFLLMGKPLFTPNAK